MIRSEFLKLKRSAIPYLVLLAAIIIPLFLLLEIASEPDQVQYYKKDPWNIILVECWKGMNFLVLHIFILLACTIIPQTEHRNNTWKQLLSSPISYTQVFFSKFAVIQILLLLVIVLFNIAVLLLTIAAQYLDPKLQLWNFSPDWKLMAGLSLKTFVSLIGLSSIQYFLGMKYKNFLVPLGVGFILWMVVPVGSEMDWVHLNKFPSAFPVYVLFTKYDNILPYILLGSAAYAVVFISISLIEFRLRKVKT